MNEEEALRRNEEILNVAAIYELPVPIWATCSALGQKYETGLGGVLFEVVMPGEGSPHGSPPADPLVEAHFAETGEELVWTQEYGAFIPESLRPATTVQRLSIVGVQAPVDSERSWRTVDHQLAESIDRWFDAVRTWVEVLTGQDLDPAHRVYDAEAVGAGLTFLEPPHQDALGLVITTPRVRPVRAGEWAGVLKAVREGKEPPLEEVLSRDARAAERRGSNRRAVIDATTAVEIVLARTVSGQYHQLPAAQQRRVDNKPSFGTFISIAEDSAISLQVTFDRLRYLNGIRNDSAHRGVAPSAFETAQAVQVMIDFLSSHGHYRRATEAEPDGSGLVVS